eukprot:CAMPEP_0197463518 /NCGR_PEP_ID=MMETSP1175-20131217/62005_1 /TAXON_ID=1003142 /ORGANISM="Triceratium dubium, Strain CCMP147" /LENGTH=69 /DNA_ID=CAMNT_0042999297 /DNA_START=112 /DNA_END=318 /DNA_ORIENTATION=+
MELNTESEGDNKRRGWPRRSRVAVARGLEPSRKAQQDEEPGRVLRRPSSSFSTNIVDKDDDERRPFSAA